MSAQPPPSTMSTEHAQPVVAASAPDSPAPVESESEAGMTQPRPTAAESATFEDSFSATPRNSKTPTTPPPTYAVVPKARAQSALCPHLSPLQAQADARPPAFRTSRPKAPFCLSLRSSLGSARLR